jgi:hypothetical protein
MPQKKFNKFIYKYLIQGEIYDTTESIPPTRKNSYTNEMEDKREHGENEGSVQPKGNEEDHSGVLSEGNSSRIMDQSRIQYTTK